MTGIDYPMCPGCRVADVQVKMAVERRENCPHCGATLVEELRVCCLPDCTELLPTTWPLPLCRSCGIKVAVYHFHDAELSHAVAAERRRRRREADHNARTGRTDTAVVYYAKLDENRIKIGFTSNLGRRMHDMRVLPANLLALEPGGRSVEAERHRQFRAARIRRDREEFRPTPELLDWCAHLREQHGNPRLDVGPPDTKTVTVRQAESCVD